MNLNWPDFANIKTDQLFENRCIYGDSVAKRKLNSFFPVFFWYNPGESRESAYFRKTAKKSSIFDQNP